MRGLHLFAWVIFGQNARKCLELHFQQVELVKRTDLFDLSSTRASSGVNPRDFNPRKIVFVGLFFRILLFSTSSGVKFVGRCSPTQTPTQKFKSGFSIFSSQEIRSSLESY